MLLTTLIYPSNKPLPKPQFFFFSLRNLIYIRFMKVPLTKDAEKNCLISKVLSIPISSEAHFIG